MTALWILLAVIGGVFALMCGAIWWMCKAELPDDIE